jgi:hypothetical protein
MPVRSVWMPVLAAVFSIGFFSGEAAFAWSAPGHLTVCDLAYRNLTKTARDELKRLFHVESGGIFVKGKGEVDDRRYTSFNVGCLEEDALPRRHPDDHFINVPRNTNSIDGASCPGTASCIFEGILRDIEILKDKSQQDEEREFALMALGHWIGDIHQPLHVSFKDDRGGNGIDVKLTGKCGSSNYRVENLHAVWDNCLLQAGLFERVRRRADFKPSWSPNTVTYRAVDTLLANTTLSEERMMVGSEPWKWANESIQITLKPDVLYCVQAGDVCRYSEAGEQLSNGIQKREIKLTQTYLSAFERIAEDRVRLAGFRLAHLINLALDPGYTEPRADSSQRQ